MNPTLKEPKKTALIDIDQIPEYHDGGRDPISEYKQKKALKKRLLIGVVLVSILLIAGLLWFFFRSKPTVSQPTTSPLNTALPLQPVPAVGVPDVAYKQRELPKELPDPLVRHIEKSRAYIYSQINPHTHLTASLPGDGRLYNWSVVYDDAMRVVMHVAIGDLNEARGTMDYFMQSTAIRKVGWIKKNGRQVPYGDWIINIVDAAEGRPGGRGVEHIAHSGPNIYIGIAAAHLYNATGERKYLDFARDRWDVVKSLQNENPKDPNYGGIRMGPLGDPTNEKEQRLEFNEKNPSFYEFYNGEHAADFKAFCNLMAEWDPVYEERYVRASRLIETWDKKIYNKKLHLFAIGTTEKSYYDQNIGEWVKPGVIPMYPLDTNALKISAYGVKGMDIFEPEAAEKIREAIDDRFTVTVPIKDKSGKPFQLHGYDFVSSLDRNKLILYEEGGPYGDKKVIKGRGRKPLLSDEWSTWVAFADLRLASDFEKRGQPNKAKRYISAYYENAIVQGVRAGVELDSGEIAYPYAHPLPYSLNKPVGFGWNTAHKPYSMIGGIARTLGLVRYDPFQPGGGRFALHPSVQHSPVAYVRNNDSSQALYTEAELYLKEAWRHVREAEKRTPDEEVEWAKAIQVVERMTKEHPDWAHMGEIQNKIASVSSEKFPLRYQEGITFVDLEKVFRKYWALYHVGTAEFIRVISYDHLLYFAHARDQHPLIEELQQKKLEAAARISTKYFYAQGYDDSGWMWQPVLSLREYVDVNDLPPTQFDLSDLEAKG